MTCSNFHFNVETWSVAGICWVSEEFNSVNSIRIGDLKILGNWNFVFRADNMVFSRVEWSGNGSSVGGIEFASEFEPEWLSTKSKIGFFHIVLEFSSCFISVNFSLPSKSHEVSLAVGSEPNLTEFLIFPGEETLSFLNVLVVNIKYGSWSNMDIFLINEILVNFKFMLWLFVSIELETEIWNNWSQFMTAIVNTEFSRPVNSITFWYNF